MVEQKKDDEASGEVSFADVSFDDSFVDVTFQEEEADSRPTIVPDFDLKEFAKQHKATVPPKSRVATADISRGELGQEMPSGVRPASLLADGMSALEVEYMSKIGSLSRVPVLRVSPTELRALPLDPSSGFLISNMDGISTLEMILDIAGMPRLEALRLLSGLLEEHVIELC